MFFKRKEFENKDTAVIIESVKQTKQQLDAAYQNFENVTDTDLVDCYIYELQAIQKRYEYLIKQAKGKLSV